MTPATTTESNTSDREIITTRVVHAPRELVWQVWTDPTHVIQWWGPTGFTNTIESMNVRVGGAWKFTMIGPDGKHWPNRIVYQEVVPLERLSYAHGSGSGNDDFHVVVTFAPEGEHTRVTLRATFATAEICEEKKKIGAVEGGKQTLAKLDDYLAKHRASLGGDDMEDFIQVRTFDAPQDLMWKVWTDPKHVSQWWGPAGFETEILRFDLKPGGIMHYCLKSPQGSMWGKLTYQEVVAPERLVYLVAFSDENAGVTRHPMSDTWPLETHSTTCFEADGKRTRLINRWRAHRSASAEERATFNAAHPSMEAGMNGTMKQLAAYLAKLQG